MIISSHTGILSNLSKVHQKLKIVESEAGWNIAQNASKWSLKVLSTHDQDKSFQPKTWRKFEKLRKWSRIEHRSKCPLTVIICSISAQKLTKLKKCQKWSGTEHCSKWLKVSLIFGRINSYFGQKGGKNGEVQIPFPTALCEISQICSEGWSIKV